jgi:hypothetical protein
LREDFVVSGGQAAAGRSSGRWAVAGLAIFVLIAACVSDARGPSDNEFTDSTIAKDNTMPDKRRIAEAGVVTVTGVRATQGNAVNCPELRDDAGQMHPVQGLTTDIALGDRVTVTGAYGITTTCKGEVLVIQTIQRS